MNDDSEISEPHFFDVLKQPVYVGDVCMAIQSTMPKNAHYEALSPVLIINIQVFKNRSGIFVVTYRGHQSGGDYQRIITKDEKNHYDQFIKVQNPEFFVDSDPMAKILAKQSDLKNDLKR